MWGSEVSNVSESNKRGGGDGGGGYSGGVTGESEAMLGAEREDVD